MNNLKLVVTGSSGFLGRTLCEELCNLYYVDKVYGITPYPTVGVHHDKFEEWILDLTVEDYIRDFLTRKKPDVIIHLAAISSPNIPQYQQATLLKTNILPTQYLAEHAPQNCRFIFASSIVVYGNYNGLPFKEGDYERPTTLYAASKLAGEKLLGVYAQQKKIKLINLRFSAMVGRNLTHGVLKDFIQKAKSDDKDFPILGNFPGSVKPYLHVTDAIRAIFYSLHKDMYEDKQMTLNISPKDNLSIDSIANLTLKHFNKDKPKLWGQTNFAGDNPILWVNNNNAAEYLHWYPSYNSEQAIIKSLEENS